MKSFSVFTQTQSPNIAFIGAELNPPIFQLFDRVVSDNGKPGIIVGIDLYLEGCEAGWMYSILGKGIDRSSFQAEEDLKAIEADQLVAA